MIRNRHLAEWRFLLFTVIVIVYPKLWNVNVIGIETPPFGWCSGTAFFRLAMPCSEEPQKPTCLTVFVKENIL